MNELFEGDKLALTFALRSRCKILTAPYTGTYNGVFFSARFLVMPTHWRNGRTVECDHEGDRLSPACVKEGLRVRFYAFAAQLGSSKLDIVEVPAEAIRPALADPAISVTLLGRMFHLSRHVQGKRTKVRLVIDCTSGPLPVIEGKNLIGVIREIYARKRGL